MSDSQLAVDVGTATVLPRSVSVEGGLGPLSPWPSPVVRDPFPSEGDDLLLSQGEDLLSHGEVLISPLMERTSGSSLSVGLFLRFKAAGLGLVTAPGRIKKSASTYIN